MRKGFYILLLLVFAILVFVKAGIIQAKRDAVTTTLFSEWNKNGKPVNAVPVSRSDLSQRIVLSGILQKNDYVSANVSPSWFDKINKITKCKAIKTQKNQPCVKSIEPTPNPLTGLVHLEIFIPHQRPMAPGTILHAAFPYKTIHQALRIPLVALYRSQGKTYVWIVSKNGTMQKRFIKTGLVNGQFVQILDGLVEGEVVVTEGSSQANQGDKIQVVAMGGEDRD
jgi:hypothetical protein